MIEHEVVDLSMAQASKAMALTPNPGDVIETARVSLRDLAGWVLAETARVTRWLRICLVEGLGAVAQTLHGPDAAHV